jgi:chromosome segregation ATPase
MKIICPATIIKIPLAAFCAVLALVSCGKKQQVAAPAVAPAASEVIPSGNAPEPEPSLEEKIAEAGRVVRRANAIADLIVAHQRISRYEGDAEQYRGFLKDPRYAGEIATLQDDLSETQNDIRDVKAEIPELEKKVKELSKEGDPSYELEVAKFLLDVTLTEGLVAQAKRARAANAGELAESLGKMQTLAPEDVLTGNYPKPPGR